MNYSIWFCFKEKGSWQSCDIKYESAHAAHIGWLALLDFCRKYAGHSFIEDYEIIVPEWLQAIWLKSEGQYNEDH